MNYYHYGAKESKCTLNLALQTQNHIFLTKIILQVYLIK